MSKVLEFMDGMDTWLGADVLNVNADVGKPFNNSPWIFDNDSATDGPIFSYRGETGLYGGAVARAKVEVMMEDNQGIGGATPALAVTNHGMRLSLSAPWGGSNGGNKLANRLVAPALSIAGGLWVKLPADLQSRFHQGFGGTLFSLRVGNGGTTKQHSNHQLAFVYNHVLDEVHVNYYSAHDTGIPEDEPGTASYFSTPDMDQDQFQNEAKCLAMVGAVDGAFIYTINITQFSELVSFTWNHLTGAASKKPFVTPPAPADAGDIVSGTRKGARFFLLAKNVVGDGGGFADGHHIYEYSVNATTGTWTYVTNFDINAHGFTNPIGICYDEDHDEFYLLDDNSGDDMYCLSNDFSTILESDLGNNFNFSTGAADICMSYHQDVSNDWNPNGTSLLNARVLVTHTSNTFQGIHSFATRRAPDAWELSSTNGQYANMFEDDAQANVGRKIWEDGMFLWQQSNPKVTSTQPVLVMRMNCQGVIYYDVDGYADGGTKAPAAILPGTETYVNFVVQPANMNTFRNRLLVWFNGTEQATSKFWDWANSWESEGANTGDGTGLHQLRLELGYFQGRNDTVAWIDDFFFYSSPTDDEFWEDFGDFPKAWQIHTSRPKITQGSMVSEGVDVTPEGRLSIVANTDKNAYVSNGYLRAGLNSIESIRYDFFPIMRGPVAGVSANFEYTREDADILLDNYPNPDHNIIPRAGVGPAGGFPYYQNNFDHDELAPVMDEFDDQKGNYHENADVEPRLHSQVRAAVITKDFPLTGTTWTQYDIDNVQLNITTFDKT